MPCAVQILRPIGYQATISAPHMHAHALELLSKHLQPGSLSKLAADAVDKPSLQGVHRNRCSSRLPLGAVCLLPVAVVVTTTLKKL